MAYPDVDRIDQDAGAYVEWHTLRGPQKRGQMILAGHEDDEEDDAPEEDDPSGQCDEDGINCHNQGLLLSLSHGPGCPVFDEDRWENVTGFVSG